MPVVLRRCLEQELVATEAAWAVSEPSLPDFDLPRRRCGSISGPRSLTRWAAECAVHGSGAPSRPRVVRGQSTGRSPRARDRRSPRARAHTSEHRPLNSPEGSATPIDRLQHAFSRKSAPSSVHRACERSGRSAWVDRTRAERDVRLRARRLVHVSVSVDRGRRRVDVRDDAQGDCARRLVRKPWFTVVKDRPKGQKRMTHEPMRSHHDARRGMNHRAKSSQRNFEQRLAAPRVFRRRCQP